jgi:hypothetical protein
MDLMQFHVEIIVKRLRLDNILKETPTTFVPLTPERIEFEHGTADLLSGVFFLKWSDMPKPSTYAMKIADLIEGDGTYLGTQLKCNYPKNVVIFLYD